MTVVLAMAACLLYLAALVLLGVLHVRFPERRPWRDAVSDYGVGPSARTFNLYTLCGSVAALLLAALFYSSRAPRLPIHTSLLLVGMVLARVGVALFPTDLVGQRRTTAGRLHYVFAIVNFGLAFTVIDEATPLLAAAVSSHAFAGWLQFLRTTALVTLVGVVLTVAGPLRRIFGTVERLFLLAIQLWFLTSAMKYVLFR